MLRTTEKTIPPKATAFEGILIYTMLKSFTPAVYVYMHSSVFKQLLRPPRRMACALFSIQTAITPATHCLYALFSIQTAFTPATHMFIYTLQYSNSFHARHAVWHVAASSVGVTDNL